MTAATPSRTVSLSPARRPRATDPNTSSTAGTTPQPTPAPLTMGPNRFTVRVPSNATKLNLGQGDTVDAVRFNKRPGVGTESGIVAQTDSHAHLHTFGTTAAEAKTLVRLGIPPTSVPPTGAYSAGASTGIGCLFPEAYSQWNGYSMVTQGGSYQESQDNHLVVSSKGEVRLVAKTQISLGTSGDVIIGASTSSTPQQLVQNQGAPSAMSATGFTDQLVRMTQLEQVGLQLAQLIIYQGQTLAALKSAELVQPMPMIGNIWGPFDYLAANVERFLSRAECAASTDSLIIDLALPPSPSGRVGIFAEKSATIGALEQVTISAGGVASLMGDWEASLRGGVTASMTGVLSASMQAASVSASGLYGATLEAIASDCTVRSVFGDVLVYSSAGSAKMTCTESCQINSVEDQVYVYGQLGSYIGCGVGVGMGLRATPAMLYMGMVADPELFVGVSQMPNGITVAPELILAQVDETTIEMLPAGINVDAVGIAVEATAITVECEALEIAAIETTIAGFVYLG